MINQYLKLKFLKSNTPVDTILPGASRTPEGGVWRGSGRRSNGKGMSDTPHEYAATT